ncbi:MAG: helix-turn-helix domain-containing protein [Alphaproteobacteria bacterium]|nr:helix-turn-helix domain-containing protein [Alphaproteobacteria bacterium]
MELKKRTYNTRLIRLGMSYTVQEVAALFRLHKGAVLRWIKDGLHVIDQRKPYLIYGAELASYLDSKQKKRKQKCRPDELFCCRCRAPRKAWKNLAEIEQRTATKLIIRAICVACNTPLYRLGTINHLPEYQKTFIIQTIGEARITETLPPIVNSDIRKDAAHAPIQPG